MDKTTKDGRGREGKGAPPELIEASKPYRFIKGFIPSQSAGRMPTIKTLAYVLRLQLDELAENVPLAKEKALEVGMDPSASSVGAVLALCILTGAPLIPH